jgi:hypothetical protein
MVHKVLRCPVNFAPHSRPNPAWSCGSALSSTPALCSSLFSPGATIATSLFSYLSTLLSRVARGFAFSLFCPHSTFATPFVSIYSTLFARSCKRNNAATLLESDQSELSVKRGEGVPPSSPTVAPPFLAVLLRLSLLTPLRPVSRIQCLDHPTLHRFHLPTFRYALRTTHFLAASCVTLNLLS